MKFQRYVYSDVISYVSAVLIVNRESQMVLIEPHLEYDPSSPTNGQMVVSVPRGDGFVQFSLPIEPTKDVLARWRV